MEQAKDEDFEAVGGGEGIWREVRAERGDGDARDVPAAARNRDRGGACGTGGKSWIGASGQGERDVLRHRKKVMMSATLLGRLKSHPWREG